MEKYLLMYEPVQKYENNCAIFKQNCFLPFKMAYFFSFCLRGYRDFLDLPQKCFVTSTTGIT